MAKESVRKDQVEVSEQVHVSAPSAAANSQDESSARNVLVKTTGMVKTFAGSGFPVVTTKGTRMTREEADAAHESAKRTYIKLEEVTE